MFLMGFSLAWLENGLENVIESQMLLHVTCETVKHMLLNKDVVLITKMIHRQPGLGMTLK